MRYDRHISLDEIGEAGQQKLLNAKILVVGAGGLGCPALQYLTAAGIGTIGIVDGDTIDESNLQRQILYTTGDVDKKKVEAARTRLESQNPDVAIRIYPENLTKQNALDIISEYDLVIDGTDNFAARYLINDACVKLDKPFVYGAIHKFEGQVSVFNLNDGPTYRCLFPEEQNDRQIPNCAEMGVLGVLPGIIGTMQATEAIKIILGIGQPLSGELFMTDLLSNKTRVIQFNKVDAQIDKALTAWEESDYKQICSDQSRSLSWEEIQDLNEMPTFLDVRQPHEQPKLDGNDVINIPLNEIPARLEEINQNDVLVVFCQHGIRSQHAIEYLKNERPDLKLINAEGGIVTNTTLSL